MTRKGKHLERNKIFSNRAEINVIDTNYIKAKINNSQQNNKFETDNYKSECSKLTQKEFNILPDCLGNVIPWELLNKLKFDHIVKWYIHKPESILENETHNVLLELQTNHPKRARRADVVLMNKIKINC